MDENQRQTYWHRAFQVGLVLKAINGIWEIGVGLLLLIGRDSIAQLLITLARGELLRHPSDWLIDRLAGSVMGAAEHTMTFLTIYILLHGVLNIFLVVQLSYDRHWAYLVTIGLMSALCAYQIYRISLYHAPALIVATGLDVLFIMLAWHEYRHHRDRHIDNPQTA